MKRSCSYLFIILLISCGGRNGGETPGFPVAVSILPQKYFVEKIGGSRIHVTVMVPPGQSPETYEPTPSVMRSVHDARILFILGVPFEEAWVSRIRSLNPDLPVIDTTRDIERREMEGHDDGAGGHDHHGHVKGMKDPHLWLDPLRVIVMANHIYDSLVRIDPAGADDYRKGRDHLVAELAVLDSSIREILKPVRGSEVFVFHPAWGYFTDRYGLKQFPVEIEGREPGPREMTGIVETVRRRGIKAILVQSQFSSQAAMTIASQTGISVVTADPLALNYTENMESVARTIAGAAK